MTDKKILIADDEANVRLLVSRALGQHFLVLEARDGEEAIKIARTHKPDLILMDLMMPRVDGNSACSIIKNDPDTKQIPVVMISGVGYELNKKLSLTLGADGYITKPFNLPDLLATIAQLLRLPG
jgi:two-component system alkaline phosphatase synthesis response regulator PhoP